MRVVNLSQPDFEQWDNPQSLIVYTTQNDFQLEAVKIRSRFPDLTVMGVSSFHGIMTSNGYKRGAFGLLFEASDNFILRQRLLDLTDVSDIRGTVRAHFKDWAEDTAYPVKQLGIHGIQGVEERVIEGLCDCFGQDVKLFGATAGKDRFLNHAYVFLNEKKVTYGVLVIQILCDRVVSLVTRGGYLMTLRKGVLTESEGRVIKTIDHRPAAEVYNEWTDRRFEANILKGGDFSRSAALYPLAHYLETEPECGCWLVHPYFIDRETKSISLYSEIPQGVEVFLMRGSEDTLIPRMGSAIHEILDLVPLESIESAFIMYCAGCASIIAERMPEVCQAACQALPGIPFIGCLSYGEQGLLNHAHRNYHGNMMIELVMIKKKSSV